MKKSLLIGLLIATTFGVHCQERTTMGTDFWISYLYFTYDYYAPQYSVSLELFASGPRPCTVTVENPNTTWSSTFTVALGTVSHITIPFDTGCTSSSGTITPTAIHVTSTDTISLYLIMLGHNNLDITNALPTDALQSNYMVQCYPSKRGTDYRSEIVIVAAEDSTVIDFTVTAPTLNGFAAGSTHTITLQQGDAYQIRGASAASDADLTGTTIQARDCKKIAVYSGHFCAYVPNEYTTTTCDHIFDQCMPTDYWGKRFVVAGTGTPFNDHVRIMPNHDDCRVIINGQLMQTLRAGEIYDYTLTQTNRTAFIETSEPACVYMFMGSAGIYDGDPSMVVVNPVDQAVRDITFGTYSTQYTRTHYVNIIADTSETSHITLDNSPITWTGVNGTSEYKTAKISIPDGSHTIRSTGDKGFIAYAFGIGTHESYGYSVGSSLRVVPTSDIFANDRRRMEDGDTILVCRGTTNHIFCITNNAVMPWRWFIDGNLIGENDTLAFIGEECGTYTIDAMLDTFSTHPCYNFPFQLEHRVVIVVLPDYVTHVHDTIPISRLPWRYNGRVYNDSVSNDTIHLWSIHHCDSTIVYSLSVYNDSNYTHVYDTICAGIPYNEHGFDLSAEETSVPGEFMYTTRDSNNVTYLHLTQVDSPTLRIDVDNFENECYRLTAMSNTEHVYWDSSPEDSTLAGQERHLSVTVCPRTTTTYFVTAYATFDSNCISQRDVMLKPRKKVESDLIWIPNVFTPEESENNLFKVYGVNISQFEIYIFHRWGTIAYHSTDINQGWDGTKDGVKCPNGTYTYLILYRNESSPIELKRKYGTVTLLR